MLTLNSGRILLPQKLYKFFVDTGIRRQYLASKQKSLRSKTRRSGGFRNLLWEFNVDEIETKVSQIKQDNDIHCLYKEGFNNLRIGFEEFLTENNLTHDVKSGYFKIYSSVAIESIDIICTTGNFYGNEWFSDVMVSSEETDWYRKVSWYVLYDCYRQFFYKLYNGIDTFFRHFYYWNFFLK